MGIIPIPGTQAMQDTMQITVLEVAQMGDAVEVDAGLPISVLGAGVVLTAHPAAQIAHTTM